MTLTSEITKTIVSKVIQSEDYRIEIVNEINAKFLQFAIGFFKSVVDAKINSQDVTIEWYRKHFLTESLPSDEICINAGINRKTIKNMYNSERREILLDASFQHFDTLYRDIQLLCEKEPDVDLTLTLKFKGVSVDLNISESMIVINTLAVKRAAIRGGAWSTAGKRAEKYIMLALCKLFQVKEKYYNAKHFVRDHSKDVDREIDFYLNNDAGQTFRCEVKLMGQGNPESADVIIARETKLFVADKMSEQNKKQCEANNCFWIELHAEEGYKRFAQALDMFHIPYTQYDKNIADDIDIILEELFEKE